MRSFDRESARAVLNTTQAIGLAFGGKDARGAIRRLSEAAGYTRAGYTSTQKYKLPRRQQGQSSKGTSGSWLDDLLAEL